MEILGVGPLEILFILVIALIVLGPKDMVQAGRTMGRWMRKIVTSPTYAIFQKTSRDLRGLPYRLMREAGMEEWEQIRKSMPTSQEILPPSTVPSLTSEIAKGGETFGATEPDQSSKPPQASDPPATSEPASWEEGLRDWTSPQPAVNPGAKRAGPKPPEPPPPMESEPT